MKGYFTYLKAKFISITDKKTKERIKHMQLNEHYNSLHHRLKSVLQIEALPIADADRRNMLGLSIYKILSICGIPDFLTSNITSGKRHEMLMYKKRLYGYKSNVMYHFIDKSLIAVMYRIQTSNNKAAINDLHALLWQQFGLDIYKLSHAALKDKNENIIELNTQHDIHIDVFYKPALIIKQTSGAEPLHEHHANAKGHKQHQFSPFEFTFL